MSELSIEIVGYAATGIITIALLPQVIKSWKTKSTGDLSVPWILFYLSGLVLWAFYGLLIVSWPLFVSSVLEAALAIFLLILAVKYRNS